MWKKDNPPSEQAAGLKVQQEPKPGKPESEGRSSTAYTALDRSAVRKGSESTEPTLISTKSTLNGEITGQSDIKIFGKFQGTIDVPKNHVAVQLSGFAKATINAQSISVHGKVLGAITAVDTVHLMSTGNVDGDIRAANVVLDKGCTFNGAIETVKEKKEETPAKPEPKSTAQVQANLSRAAKPARVPAQGTQGDSS